MTARVTTATTLVLALSTMLPARAADPQLLGMVMPGAKVLAGVNVLHAKGTPFGAYVLGKIQTNDQEMLKFQQLTGFNPTSDVTEVLAASTGVPQSHTGLVLARGNFDPSKIAAAAAAKGALSEVYNGATILEDPQRTHGLAFVGTGIAIAGDLASVKGALDRQNAPSTLPTALSTQVFKLSSDQDAWVVSTVPFATLKPPSAPPNVPNLTQSTAFQSVQQASAGVKFGQTEVQFTAQAQADTAENATAMANVVQLLVNMAQMQGQQNPQAVALAKSVVVNTAGNLLNLSLSIPEDQFQQIFNHSKHGPSVTPNAHERRPMHGRQM